MKKQSFATWKAPSKMPEWYANALGGNHVRNI